MPSFFVAGEGTSRELAPEKGASLERNELNGLSLLKKLTNDYPKVPMERAYLQLGRLRALMWELERYNKTFKADADTAMDAYVRATASEVLSSVDIPSGQPVVLDDLESMIEAIEGVSQDRLEETRRRILSGSIEYLDLAEVYQPGSKVLGPTGGLSQEMGFLVRSCFFEEVKTPFGKKHAFNIELEFFASVGDRFSAVRCQDQVGWWRGLRELSGLFLRPLPDEGRQHLTDRGTMYSKVASGSQLLMCKGGCFITGKRRGAVREGRVMVDIIGARESGAGLTFGSHADAAPNALDVQTTSYTKAVRQGRLEKKDPAVVRDESTGFLLIDRMFFFREIPPERLWNCWPLVPAFSMHLKCWGQAEVSGLTPVAWQDQAWDLLVLPPQRKALIRAVVQRQREVHGVDLIEGKGEGSTFLLYGPPGTGKTLTAEAMAETLHRPLYVLSAGEMGTTPQELETTLANALELCSRWDCICLIDEADIFLEQRTGADVVRNALVCVMLRQLEYHPGVLFLTTNRAKGIDPAVQSRLTLALRYETLDYSAREEVWSNLLRRVQGGPFDCSALARLAETNGRQIKNCIHLCMALALDQGAPMTQQMIEGTLETVCAFQRDLRGDSCLH